MNTWLAFALGVAFGFGGAVLIATILPRKANTPHGEPKA